LSKNSDKIYWYLQDVGDFIMNRLKLVGQFVVNFYYFEIHRDVCQNLSQKALCTLPTSVSIAILRNVTNEGRSSP